MQNEEYHTTLWRVGSRKGAQGGILDGWVEKVRGRFPKAVARSFRRRVYSPRFNMSGNLAMLDASHGGGRRRVIRSPRRRGRAPTAAPRVEGPLPVMERRTRREHSLLVRTLRRFRIVPF